MNDFLTTILKRYGVTGLLGGVMGVILIWVIAHSTAAPGTEVSIAWGLVAYTKPESHIQNEESVSKKPNNNQLKQVDDSPSKVSSGKKSLPKITLHQIHFETEPTQSALRVNREKYNLRQLLPLESGRPIRETPSGSYFFSLLPWFNSDGPDVTADFLKYEVQRYSIQFKLEFQRSVEGELYMLGFASTSDSAHISTLGGVEKSIMVTAQWHEQFKVLVRIPVSRIRSSSDRSVNLSEKETINILDLVVI